MGKGGVVLWAHALKKGDYRRVVPSLLRADAVVPPKKFRTLIYTAGCAVFLPSKFSGLAHLGKRINSVLMKRP